MRAMMTEIREQMKGALPSIVSLQRLNQLIGDTGMHHWLIRKFRAYRPQPVELLIEMFSPT